MWDEEERFAKLVSRIFTWLLASAGVVLIATSLATGIPDFFLAFLLLLAALAAVTLSYGLVAVGVGGLLLGVTTAVSHCLHWLRNRCGAASRR
jgi:hypothetical protein